MSGIGEAGLRASLFLCLSRHKFATEDPILRLHTLPHVLYTLRVELALDAWLQNGRIMVFPNRMRGRYLAVLEILNLFGVNLNTATLHYLLRYAILRFLSQLKLVILGGL